MKGITEKGPKIIELLIQSDKKKRRTFLRVLLAEIRPRGHPLLRGRELQLQKDAMLQFLEHQEMEERREEIQRIFLNLNIYLNLNI